jgi:asparagine synthase (glutamine-hydrolysing)
MSKWLGTRPKTFTLGFADRGFDERIYAKRVAQQLDVQAYEQVLESWDPALLQTLICDHVGQPFADPSLLPTALVSELAARYVKVCLSGDGGDELFSGYQRYQAQAIMRWYSRLPASLRRGAERALRALPEPMSHHSRSWLKKAQLFVDTARRQKLNGTYIGPRLLSDEHLVQLAPELASRGHRAPMLPEVVRLDDITKMMFSDALVYLPQDILVKVDRATMAHSLEARAPFLDRELVELAFSVPIQDHRSVLGGKKLLRNGFSDMLPGFVLSRRKQGFSVPVHDWVRGRLGDRLLGLVAGPYAYGLSAGVIREMLTRHRRRTRDFALQLWQILVYLEWRRAA